MKNSRKIWLLILIVSLVIMGVEWIYTGGEFFLLDYISYPVTSWNLDFWRVNLITLLAEGGMRLLGYQLFSKLFFFVTIFLSGWLGFVLAIQIANLFKVGSQHHAPLAIAGVFLLMLNPVLYERMITQPGVYLAFVVMGFGLVQLLKTISDWRIKYYLFAGLLFGGAIGLSSHTVFMSGVFCLIYALLYLRIKKVLLGLVLLIVMTLLPNLNWLIGGFWGNWSVVTDTLATFNQANIEGFLSHALAPFNLELTSLMLYGFWGERAGHLVFPEDVNPLWWVFSVILFVVSIGGYRFSYKNNKKLVWFFILVWLLSWIFATGISSSRFWALNQWMFDNIPYYIGLREPQKWVGLLFFVRVTGILLAFSKLLCLLDELRWSRREMQKQIVPLGVLVLILIANTPALIWGFYGQLVLSDYPTDYQTYKQTTLSWDLKKGKILILPRHSYLACPRTQRKIISNPLKAYLGNHPQIVSSDNIELTNLYTNSTSSESRDIENFLVKKDLALLSGFSTIIMMENCADYQNYDFLKSHWGLQMGFSSPSLSVYYLK